MIYHPEKVALKAFNSIFLNYFGTLFLENNNKASMLFLISANSAHFTIINDFQKAKIATFKKFLLKNNE